MGISLILSLLCGVSLFLFGMSLMGDSLKKVAGNKMETILYKLTNTPIKGLLLGTIVTAIIQSSGATTVMIVGFVNSGMMKLAQSIGIIMGANIGTSITGWILCLSYLDGSNGIASLLSTATISAVIAIVGIVMRMFSKKSVYRNTGDIMLGFAILMTGMQMMSSSVAPLKENEFFVNALTMFSNPVMGILAGILITVVLQSASASVGVVQALSATGSITFAVALPIIMGIGIGASCPVLLSAIGTNKDGKRTALVYLLNDTFGMLIWSIIFYSANAVAKFSFMELTMDPVKIALINTLFRMATVMVLLPFMKLLEKLVCRLIKDSPEDAEEQADFSLLDDRFLNYPVLAITQTQQVMNDVAKRSKKAVRRAFSLFSEFSSDIFNKVKITETLIDKYEDKLGTYLIKLTTRKMTPGERQKVTKFLYTISDFESLSDYALNIAFIARELSEKGVTFSEMAQKELATIEEATLETVNLLIEGFIEEDFSKIRRVEPLRDYINILIDDIKERHVARLQVGQCSLADGEPFNDILANIERICAHCANIAIAITKVEYKNFNKNKYITGIKDVHNDVYIQLFNDYRKKYVVHDTNP